MTTGNSEGTHFRSRELGTEVVCPRSGTESLPLGFLGHSVLPLAQGAGETAAVTGLLKIIMLRSGTGGISKKPICPPKSLQSGGLSEVAV